MGEILSIIAVVIIIFVLYSIIRIKNIQKEIDETGKIENRGIFENILKKPIEQDILQRQKDIEQAKQKKTA